jgi:type IV pilus assembly protein PilQ
MESDTIKNHAAAEDKSNEVANQLIETLNAPPEQKVYHGSRVSFEASNADVHDIFRLVGDASGLNVLTTGDVKATMSLSLKDVPWDQLLDIVLQQNSLKAAVMGNVVRVSTLEAYNKEQEEKTAAIRLGETLDPVIMAIIPLSYAKAAQMKTMISDLVVKTDAAPGAGAGAAAAGAAMVAKPSSGGTAPLQAFVRGQIEVDERSNSLVITNTKEAIDRIRRLVKELDVALPQVLIDSKIVIASDNFSKSLGVSYGGYAANVNQSQGGSLSFNNGAAVAGTSTTSTTTIAPPAFAVTSTAATSSQGSSGTIGMQQLIGNTFNLNMALSVAELKGLSKTVSSPRVIVNNKQTANVTDGTQIATVTPGTANNPATTTYVQASMTLNVVPQITSAGSVLMDVQIHKDAPVAGSANIDTKSLSTQVLVDSGATLVLGGVYAYQGTSSSTGIPGLMDLPIIGSLFRTDSQSMQKDELMVFITPQILNTGNQGITDKM